MVKDYQQKIDSVTKENKLLENQINIQKHNDENDINKYKSDLSKYDSIISNKDEII